MCPEGFCDGLRRGKVDCIFFKLALESIAPRTQEIVFSFDQEDRTEQSPEPRLLRLKVYLLKAESSYC